MARARLIAGFAAVVVALVAGVAGTVGAALPGTMVLSLSEVDGEDGPAIHVDGECYVNEYDGCDHVMVRLYDPNGVQIGSTTAKPTVVGGHFAATLGLPPGPPCGHYTVFAEGFDVEDVVIAQDADGLPVRCQPPMAQPTTETSTTVQPTSDVAPSQQARPRFTG